MNALLNIFEGRQFIPHGHCYLWKTGLVALHISSDLFIALAYFSIPTMLIYFVYKRGDLPSPEIFLLFGSFIIACGITHLMEIYTLWYPTYWLSGFLKAITAAISVYTAITLIPLIPQLLSLPTSEELIKRAVNELKQSQTVQLIQTEKMSSLGKLVAGVAHEINNPVSFIYGNITPLKEYTHNLIELVEIYKKNYPNPCPEIVEKSEEIELDFLIKDVEQILNSVKVGATRIKEIVLSLRNFSRVDETELKFTDIHEGIESTLLILQSKIKENKNHCPIEIIKSYGKLPLVECYPVQLNQVCMNILSNAIDAIDTKNFTSSSEKPQIYINTQITENNQILITISDNGCGMEQSLIDKIFDPFFTTKPIGKGTGLGLAISYDAVVKKHHGHIKCNSELEKGTKFVIEIPIKQ